MTAELPLRGFCFSQTSLESYARCRQQFLLRYRRRLSWPAPLTQEAAAWEAAGQRGQLFHLLVHQDALGLDVNSVVEHCGDPQLQTWWRNYRRYPPRELPRGQVFSELELSAPVAGCRVMARLDRVVVGEDGRIAVVDWKTGTRPADLRSYTASWQTLVYRYVLVEAGQILVGGPVRPEQVGLLYWHASQPGNLPAIGYSAAEHEQVRGRLEEVVRQIAGLEEEEFVRTPDLGQCQRCQYRSYCERGRQAAAEWEVEEEDLDGDVTAEPE